MKYNFTLRTYKGFYNVNYNALCRLIYFAERACLVKAACFLHSFLSLWERDSSVGIATRYGLEVPGIESRWERSVPHPSRPALGSTQPPIQLVPGLFSGVKAAGVWR